MAAKQRLLSHNCLRLSPSIFGNIKIDKRTEKVQLLLRTHP